MGERRRLPDTRGSLTRKIVVGETEMYVTCGFHDDGTLGEVFIKVAKAGSFVRGTLDALCMTISIALQSNVEWDTLAAKYEGQRFEPYDENSTSVIDAIARAVTELRNERAH